MDYKSVTRAYLRISGLAVADFPDRFNLLVQRVDEMANAQFSERPHLTRTGDFAAVVEVENVDPAQASQVMSRMEQIADNIPALRIVELEYRRVEVPE